MLFHEENLFLQLDFFHCCIMDVAVFLVVSEYALSVLSFKPKDLVTDDVVLPVATLGII
jgi:hypothetical protein